MIHLAFDFFGKAIGPSLAVLLCRSPFPNDFVLNGGAIIDALPSVFLLLCALLRLSLFSFYALGLFSLPLLALLLHLHLHLLLLHLELHLVHLHLHLHLLLLHGQFLLQFHFLQVRSSLVFGLFLLAISLGLFGDGVRRSTQSTHSTG